MWGFLEGGFKKQTMRGGGGGCCVCMLMIWVFCVCFRLFFVCFRFVFVRFFRLFLFYIVIFLKLYSAQIIITYLSVPPLADLSLSLSFRAELQATFIHSSVHLYWRQQYVTRKAEQFTQQWSM